jgi:hypothetical protein
MNFVISKLVDCCCEEFEFENRFGFGFGILEVKIDLDLDLCINEFCIRDFWVPMRLILKKNIYTIFWTVWVKTIRNFTDDFDPNHP